MLTFFKKKIIKKREKRKIVTKHDIVLHIVRALLADQKTDRQDLRIQEKIKKVIYFLKIAE